MTAFGRGRRVVRLVLVITGWAVLVVAVDWGLGWAWDQVDPGDAGSQQTFTVEEGSTDPRVDSPALADADWRQEYFAELQHLNYEYVPFLYPRVAHTESRYINSDGGLRRSYEPDGGDLPEVWFFGGSTVWGEGQRDLHTIPSEFARVAEAAGTPVRVRNFGERSYVLWQDAQLFERELAHRDPPDLAVFYGGGNEFGVQFEHPSPDPTHGDWARIDDLLEGRALGPGPPVEESSDGILDAFRDLADDYRETSAVARAVDRIRSVVAVAPAAAQAPSDRDAEIDANGEAVYRRGRDLAAMIGDQHGVPTAFFWQPLRESQPEDQAIADRLEPQTVDLLHFLDDPPAPVFIDGIHTNELGARLVAEAMWDELRPALGDDGS